MRTANVSRSNRTETCCNQLIVMVNVISDTPSRKSPEVVPKPQVVGDAAQEVLEKTCSSSAWWSSATVTVITSEVGHDDDDSGDDDLVECMMLVPYAEATETDRDAAC